MKRTLFFIIMTGLVACSKSSGDKTTVTDADIEFMQQVSLANYAAIDEANIADSNAEDAMVKSFGNNILATQPGIQSDLIALAASLNINLPTEADSAHKNQAAHLRNLHDSKFDNAYINAQVAAYRNTISLYNTELSKGNNSEVINFARKNLPAMVSQSNDATDIQALLQ